MFCSIRTNQLDADDERRFRLAKVNDGHFGFWPNFGVLENVDTLSDLLGVNVAKAQHFGSVGLGQAAVKAAPLFARVPYCEAVRPFGQVVRFQPL